MDVGSRRLVARNSFRNTINAFTGAELRWETNARHVVRAFAVMPVIRLPSGSAALGENAIVFDRENTSALFWGAFAASAPLAERVELEAYVLGLHEGDHPLAPSANRQLLTAGVRVMRAPADGRFDFQLEAMAQLGTSRASTVDTDTTALAHRAASAHLALGYRIDATFKPHVSARYDFASGDADPADGLNGRFDPLFGARAFDFGPTGLYGAFARSNLQSPAVRLELTFHRTVDALLLARLCWLASPRDAWVPAGLVDPTGASGSFIGAQLGGRVRWRPFPGNLALEAGATWLSRGGFARTVSGARPGDPVHVYVELTGAL
jgi:hypothetical protein